jgi:hypothetical protein
MQDNNMECENRFLILISRVTFNKENLEELIQILNGQLEWFYIIAQSFRHKITGLIWTNMKKLDLAGYIPRAIAEPMSFYTHASRERFQIMEKEAINMLTEFAQSNISTYPLKGAVLIPELYGPEGVRISNDMDFMIRKQDVSAVNETMSRIGYITGEIDPFTKGIVPYTREKKIMWMRMMDNLPSFYKKSTEPYLDYMTIDFRHSINRNHDIVNGMTERSKGGKLDPTCFYLHLCYHAHDEAGQYNAHNMLKDITLMKFCDIREYTLKYINGKLWDDVIDTARQYQLEKPIYFCINALEIIYADGYEKEILTRLHIDDEDVMNVYGEKEFGRKLTFKNSFIDRLFSFNNKAEMEESPNWTKV